VLGREIFWNDKNPLLTTSRMLTNKTAEIIPAVNIPYSQLQIYTYLIPSSLKGKVKLGQLVKIPFRRREIKGVIIKMHSRGVENSKIKLLPISSLDDSMIVLSEAQIKLAEFISEHYHTSLGLVIKTILPPITKREPRKKIEFDFSEETSITLKKNLIPQSELKQLSLKLLKNKKTLFVHNLTAARHQVYLKLIKNVISKNRQIILLLPDIFDIRQFAGFYTSKISAEKIAVLHSEITDAQFYKEWQKINSGKVKLIIGTRMAVFAPVKKLGLIIMDDEHSSNYKQWDQNPRYHARETALKLTELTGSKIIFSSPAPSLESFYGIKNKVEFILTPPDPPLARGGETPLDKRETNPPLSKGGQGGLPLPKKEIRGIRIIDMNQERQKRNFSIFSDDLKDSLIEQLKNKKQIILFVPRRGFHTFTLCRDCGYVAECSQCRSPLVSHQNGNLICRHCHLQTKPLIICPACQSSQIKSFGVGTQKAEEEIKNVIRTARPLSSSLKNSRRVRICRLDSDTAKNKKPRYKIYRDFISGKIDILIGTQIILKNWNLSNLGLTGVVSADGFLSLPDFRSPEKSFQTLKQIALQNRNNAKIIIQTYHPENKVLKAILSEDLKNFYRQELSGRKISFGLDYPPFSQIIKLIHQNKNARLGERNAREMYQVLKNKIAETDNKQFEIMEPFPASNYQIRGKFRWHIIIKSICQDTSLRDKLLEPVGKDWIIDVDPESLL